LDLIRRAARPPLKRRATKPTAAARERRIEGKKRRAGIKRLRRTKPSFD
jgi:ribosome-associated protein